jgi:hypothetical protein
MSIISRLAIALVVGLVAAGLNALALRSPTKRAEYVSFARAVQQGEAVSSTALAALAVPGDPAVVGRTLVAWKDRGLLLQMRAPRGYAVGDVALQRDVRDAIRLARRDDLVLLQFRVIAVGDRFKRQEATDADGADAGRGNFVTIAVRRDDMPPKPDDTSEVHAKWRQARRMVRVVTQPATLGKPAAEDRILGVAVFPRAKIEPAAKPATEPVSALATEPRKGNPPIEQPADDEMLLTVPLEGIESVPDVILVGGNIGFFMLPEYP